MGNRPGFQAIANRPSRHKKPDPSLIRPFCRRLCRSNWCGSSPCNRPRPMTESWSTTNARMWHSRLTSTCHTSTVSCSCGNLRNFCLMTCFAKVLLCATGCSNYYKRRDNCSLQFWWLRKLPYYFSFEGFSSGEPALFANPPKVLYIFTDYLGVLSATWRHLITCSEKVADRANCMECTACKNCNE